MYNFNENPPKYCLTSLLPVGELTPAISVVEDCIDVDTKAASLLLERLKDGRLPMHRNYMIIDKRLLLQFSWNGLRSKKEIEYALAVLEGYGYVRRINHVGPLNFKIHSCYHELYQRTVNPS